MTPAVTTEPSVEAQVYFPEGKSSEAPTWLSGMTPTPTNCCREYRVEGSVPYASTPGGATLRLRIRIR